MNEECLLTALVNRDNLARLLSPVTSLRLYSRATGEVVSDTVTEAQAAESCIMPDGQITVDGVQVYVA